MLSVHNSLTGKIEIFKPLVKGEVRMYHCGPTVYNYAHIGNMRSYVFGDLLRRTCEYLGHSVKQVINITDIGHLTSDADSGDDKMMKGLKCEGLPFTLEGLKKLGDKYEQAFKDDLDTLNILKPHNFPRATEYLNEEIELVKELEKNGFAYKLNDGVYFDTSKLKSYGKLGGLTPVDESIARVGSEGKKSPRDFVLWKLSEDDHLGFESPWGMGFPGWHIECSAMSRKLLGQPFDIHTGGIDHIPVHHNNEIAQSEAAYQSPLANYWLHNEFVNLSGDKMAKSEGNTLTIKTLEEKGFSPLAYRYLLLLSHYRSPTTFSFEALEAAQNAYRKLKNFVSNLPIGGEIDEVYKNEFLTTIENDLNSPEALAVVWKLVKDESTPLSVKRATLVNFDKVLGLKLEQNEFSLNMIPEEIQTLMDLREKARRNDDYSTSDEIRKKINDMGFIIEDTESGAKISKA